MNAPQSGIFALGNPSHAYLEFNLQPAGDPRALVTAMADLREPRTTIGGVNLVSGFRPELWRELLPEGLPDGLVGFNEDGNGADQYVIPATQPDPVPWHSASPFDAILAQTGQ